MLESGAAKRILRKSRQSRPARRLSSENLDGQKCGLLLVTSLTFAANCLAQPFPYDYTDNLISHDPQLILLSL